MILFIEQRLSGFNQAGLWKESCICFNNYQSYQRNVNAKIFFNNFLSHDFLIESYL